MSSLGQIEINLATNQQQVAWDEYVKQHKNATPYHMFAWGLAVEQAYQHKAYYLIATQQNTIVGVLPLVQFKKPFAKQQLCSLPFCDLGGVLADSKVIEQALLAEAGKWLMQNNQPFIDYRATEVNYDSAASEQIDLDNKKVRMLLQLPENSQALWDGFKSKLRSQIRKAEKNGLTAEISLASNKEQKFVDGFYQVISRNMRDLGSPVHSKAWFDSILNFYGENSVIALVYKDDIVVGAGIVLTCGNKACIPWASTVAEYNRLAPNMLLYWTLLQHVADNNIANFDFGRSTFNEGTYRFKAQWGAQAELLDWCQLNAQGQRINTETHATGKGKMRARVEEIWRKLPLAVTETVGPKVRKYISL
ncbi:FemAB family XrtA/PEP-CTERM system-associated protein [Catenovulum agarivorans]|uniref:FemAB family XrtA/PEP-CTERM system-associated protein n=1 Tax=Catenovulum agarivorans TaxID=1172192 RepID=UPI0002FF6B28|nr:FemAB family XrtA/PEP-CTERM system-associated protein [Catenovulum agarivorans]